MPLKIRSRSVLPAKPFLLDLHGYKRNCRKLRLSVNGWGEGWPDFPSHPSTGYLRANSF